MPSSKRKGGARALEKDDWRPRFLLTLRKIANVNDACEAVGISRVTAYDRRQKDPHFRAQWDDALQDAVDRLEKRGWQMALHPREPSEGMIKFLLGAHRPHMYRRPKDTMVGQVIVIRPREGVERQLTSLEDLEGLTTDELQMLAGEIDVEVGDYRLLEDEDTDPSHA
jgi:hypothetical protein